MSGDDDSTDKGLARERTALSWNRSGLAVIVCIAVLLRRLWPLRGTRQLVVLGVVAAAAMVWALAILAFSIKQDSRHGRFPLGHSALGLMTVGTVLLALGALVLTLLFPD
jgi:uncharacterized membrane protein YidH (DUF202 family)